MNEIFNGILVVRETPANTFPETTFAEIWKHIRSGGILGCYRTETVNGRTRTGLMLPYTYWLEDQIAGVPQAILIAGTYFKEGEDGKMTVFTP